MSSRKTLTPEAKQNLDNLARALYMFLEEVDGYRSRCVKHEKSTALRAGKDGMVHLSRQYKASEGAMQHIKTYLEQAESYTESRWLWDSREWQRMEKKAARQQGVTLAKGIHHEGWPMMVTVRGDGDDIIVSISLPSLAKLGMEDFPIRQVSTGLLMHEHLVPECFGTPQPVKHNREGYYPIGAYIRRVMRNPDDVMVTALIEHWPKCVDNA